MKKRKKGKEKERKRDQEGTPRRRRCGQWHLLSPPPLSSVPRRPPSPVVPSPVIPSSVVPSSPSSSSSCARGPSSYPQTRGSCRGRERALARCRVGPSCRRRPPSVAAVVIVRGRRPSSSWSWSWSSMSSSASPSVIVVVVVVAVPSIGQRWRRRHQLLRGRMDGAVLTWRALHGPLPRPSLVHPGSPSCRSSVAVAVVIDPAPQTSPTMGRACLWRVG